MDKLFQLLNEQAAGLDEFNARGADPWKVQTHPDFTRVDAQAKLPSSDPEAAWRNATELRDAILGLGHRLHGKCTIGVVSETTVATDGAMPIVAWCGQLNLAFRTK